MKTSKIILVTMAAAIFVGGIAVYKTRAENGRPGFARGQIVQRIIKGLGLTDDQISKIKTQLRAEKDTLVPLLKNLHDTRKTLRDTVNQPGASEADVRAAAAKVAAVEADLAVERAKLSGKIAPILTEEQVQKAKDFQAKADDFVINALKTVGEKLGE